MSDTSDQNRTSAGLRATLFEEMDLVRAGKSDPPRAQAVAKLAAQIISSVRMELEFYTMQRKALERAGGSESSFPKDLGVLKLGVPQTSGPQKTK